METENHPDLEVGDTVFVQLKRKRTFWQWLLRIPPTLENKKFTVTAVDSNTFKVGE